MIKSVTVTNYLGDSIKMDLMRPEQSGFVIQSITGLGAGKADVRTTEISTMDGGIFNSSRLPSRNIVIGLKFLWKNTIEDVRQMTYKYFPIKRKVTLLFETDNRTCEIEGYVESNEPNIFSKDEQTSISIICPNPYFYSIGTNTTVFGGIEPAFEFPFSNESLTENLLEMSVVALSMSKNVIYNGDAEIGITATIYASGEVTNIAIYNVTTHEIMRIDTDRLSSIVGSGIKSGDEIVICTVQGSKSIRLIRNGNTTNILNCLRKDSNWIRLVKGDNVFVCTAETGDNALQFKIENKIAYEGV